MHGVVEQQTCFSMTPFMQIVSLMWIVMHICKTTGDKDEEIRR